MSIRFEKLLENEEHRWSYMNDMEMRRRLSRISNLDKLDVFCILAARNNKEDLRLLAVQKRRQLLGQNPEMEDPRPELMNFEF